MSKYLYLSVLHRFVPMLYVSYLQQNVINQREIFTDISIQSVIQRGKLQNMKIKSTVI